MLLSCAPAFFRLFLPSFRPFQIIITPPPNPKPKPPFFPNPLASSAPADPAQAADMDNASFLASLPPDLREEILLQATDEILATLPPNLVAEAQARRSLSLYSFPLRLTYRSGLGSSVS